MTGHAHEYDVNGDRDRCPFADCWWNRFPEFVSSLGAHFKEPGTDEIVRWQDVRDGDTVLLDDELVTAEKVSILQKPWGDGTTFTAADISHRLENGYLAVSERHGDRYTAVRRPAPERAARTEQAP